MKETSAVSITPVQIWEEIFSYLFSDPIAFDTSPFYPECNYHIYTAVQEWRNPARLMQTARQHTTLRRVCRAWKCLVDVYAQRYHELSLTSTYKDIIRVSRRAHLTS